MGEPAGGRVPGTLSAFDVAMKMERIFPPTA